MELSVRLTRSFRGAMLISGTSIGAGMLGIPMVTAGCGFATAVGLTFIVWAFMLATGFLLLEATLSLPPKANFISIARAYLGKWGAWVAGGLFVFLYYFFLVAYIAAGGPLLGDALSLILVNPISTNILLLTVTGVFACVVAAGPKWVNYVCVSLSLVMFASFFALFFLQIPNVDIKLLSNIRFGGGYIALPVLFGAFGFHNVIPSLVTDMKRDKRSIQWAIIIGTSLPLLFYILWQMIILGSFSPSAVSEASFKGNSIISYLASQANQPLIQVFGILFAFLALTTSLLGVSFSLVDFLGDGFKVDSRGKWRIGLTCLTFIPPLIGALIHPEIFSLALGIAGGIGESLLNGLIPIALVYCMGKRGDKHLDQFLGQKGVLAVLSVFALYVMGVEIVTLLSNG